MFLSSSYYSEKVFNGHDLKIQSNLSKILHTSLSFYVQQGQPCGAMHFQLLVFWATLMYRHKLTLTPKVTIKCFPATNCISLKYKGLYKSWVDTYSASWKSDLETIERRRIGDLRDCVFTLEKRFFTLLWRLSQNMAPLPWLFTITIILPDRTYLKKSKH